MPALRAFESPIAMACFRLVTFLPLRPLFSLPAFISRISVSTFLPAEGEYFRVDDFFAAFFVAFFAVLFRVVLFFAAFFVLFFAAFLVDFLLAFLVAIMKLSSRAIRVRQPERELSIIPASSDTFCIPTAIG